MILLHVAVSFTQAKWHFHWKWHFSTQCFRTAILCGN